MKTGLIKLVAVLIINQLLVNSASLFAQDTLPEYKKTVIPKEEFTQFHSGSTVAVNDSFTVIDDKFLDPAKWSTIDTTYYVKNRVYFALNLDTTMAFTKPISCRVDLEITKWDAQSQVSYDYPSLTVTYDTTKGSTFIYYAFYNFEGAYKYTVKILQVDYEDSDNNLIAPPLFLAGGETSMQRSYNYECNDELEFCIGDVREDNRLPFTFNNGGGGGNEFDFEWTFYDSYSIVYEKYENNTQDVDDGLFRNNASRITTTNNSYDLSLVYPKGYLFFRIRSVQVQEDGQRIEGAWYYSFNCSTAVDAAYEITEDHMEGKVNWQYSSLFSEEGNLKESVSYFDGTLRDRQAVQRVNSTNIGNDYPGEIVVSQTVYDYQGRPAVNVLPAPSGSAILQYFNEFNLSDQPSGKEYSKLDFDEGSCNADAPLPMNLSAGASNYYSPQNPKAEQDFNRFIPDAYLYPFSQVEYTPDLTGRIKRQSGVGLDLSLNAGKKFTSFQYGKPAQEELYNMFTESDVGNNSHYSKDLTIDPNWQVSVAYKNMSGKVIATALAGECPDNLQALDQNSGPSEIITINLLDGVQSSNGDDMISTYSYINVVENNEVTIRYQLLPPSYTDENCLPNICYDCLYDLEVRVTDDCGQIFYSNEINNGQILNNFGTLDRDRNIECEADIYDDFDLSFSEITLPNIGTYHIEKRLRVSQAALNFFTEDFIARNSCNQTLEDFITNALVNVDFSGCNLTCEACTTYLSDESSFETHYITVMKDKTNIPDPSTELISQWTDQAEAAYNSLHELCNAMCEPKSPCEFHRIAMLSDMMPPGGQYARANFNVQTQTYSAVTDPTSIFNDPGSALPIFQRPIYTSEDWVEINNVMRDPAGLDLNDYIINFQPSWKERLLQFHPEYCALLACEETDAVNSQIYDQEMMKVNTFSEACSLGYLDPLGNAPSWVTSVCTTSNPDPFFATGPGSTTTMTNAINNLMQCSESTSFASLWQMVIHSVQNPSCDLTYDPCDITSIPSLCDADMDIIWSLFKGIYQGEKSKLFNNYLLATCTTIAHCNIGCANAQLMTYSGCTPCSSGDYSNKSPRFSSNLKSTLSEVLIPECDPESSSYDCETCMEFYHQSPCTTEVSEAFIENCEKYCEDNASKWVDQFEKCYKIANPTWNLTSGERTTLENDFKSICQNGCNENHPFGSRNLPEPSPAYYPNSFTLALNLLGYTDCTDFFTMPPDYSVSFNLTSPGSTVNIPVSEICDPCICTTMVDKRNGMTDEEYYTWLIANYPNTHLTYEDFKMLITACAETTCTRFSRPIEIPAAFACAPECKDCNEIAVKYSMAVNVNSPSDPSDISWQKAMADFMNSELGFSYSYNEYIAFLRKCNYAVIPCDILTAKVTEYNAIDPPMPLILWLNLQFGIQYSLQDYINWMAAIDCDAFENNNNDLHRDIDPDCDAMMMAHDLFMSQPGIDNMIYPFTDMYLWFIENYWNESEFNLISNNHYGSFLELWSANDPECDFELPAEPTFTYQGDEHTYCDDLPTYVGEYDDQIHPPLNLYLNIRFNLCLNEHDYVVLYMACTYDDDPLPSSSDELTCEYLYDALENYLAYHSNVTSNPNLLLHEALTFFVENYWKNETIASLLGILNNPSLNSCPNNDPIEAFLNRVNSGCENLETVYENYFTNNIPTPLLEYLNASTFQNFTMKDYVAILKSCEIADIYDSPVNLLCGRALFEFPAPEPNDCVDMLINAAVVNATKLYQEYIHAQVAEFQANYIAHCINPTVVDETFEMDTKTYEYQYTLYYYDQAGNLVKTVPPAGVDLTSSHDHSLTTTYLYNTLNKVYYQNTPDGDAPREGEPPADGGITQFWYDNLGRIVASQNSEQEYNNNEPTTKRYSYTLYDNLGRIIESGELENDVSLTDAVAREPGDFENWFNSSNLKRQVTHTFYDEPFISLNQNNCRNRVVSVTVEDEDDADPSTYNSASHYDYDISGNVKTLIQDNQMLDGINNAFKTIDYEYDLVSGKVTKVDYQNGRADEFIHEYSYDTDNRLTEVNTRYNEDNPSENDAQYFYYRHGPLARTVLGEQEVQGIDYSYTLQGWLKGINSTRVDKAYDMGGDGVMSSTNQFVGTDAYAMTLGYYDERDNGGNKDYDPIDNTVAFEGAYDNTSGTFGAGSPSLFNGNIRHIALSLLCGDNSIGYAYKYDQLNRLKERNTYDGFESTSSNSWAGSFYEDSYHEEFAYDANGNFSTAMRNWESNNVLDNLTYTYYSGTNQLVEAYDSDAGHDGMGDIGGTHTYEYDRTGKLVLDALSTPDPEETDLSISWNVNGKVRTIDNNNDESNILTYYYDPFGNRIAKRSHDSQADTYNTTYYVRDAQGNILITYTEDNEGNLYLGEHILYGSTRLGVLKENYLLYDNVITHENTTEVPEVAAGKKFYELTNHLGNVMTVINDVKDPISGSSGIEYYNPQVINASDYYSFGMLMHQNCLSQDYRFGFNGQEKTDEISGVGNHNTAEYWEYDTRLGRRWNIDPVIKTWESPYATFRNNPIIYADPFGLDSKDKREAEAGAVDPPNTQYGNNDNERSAGNTTQHFDQACGCYVNGPASSSGNNNPDPAIPEDNNFSYRDIPFAEPSEVGTFFTVRSLQDAPVNKIKSLLNLFDIFEKISTYVAPIFEMADMTHDISQNRTPDVPILGFTARPQLEELDNTLLDVAFRRGYQSFAKELSSYNSDHNNAILGVHVTNAEFVQAQVNGINVHNIQYRVEAGNFASNPGNDPESGDPYTHFIFFKASLMMNQTINPNSYGQLPISNK